jgi:hypothetical protein
MSKITPFFAEMENYISNCRRDIASGKDVDMQGMEIKIEALCNMVWEQSEVERLVYEPRLRSLLENLNELGKDLKEQIDGTRDIPQHRAASVAYKTADSRDNFGKRDGEK